MGLWDSFVGGTTDFIGGMPMGGGSAFQGTASFTPQTSISTNMMQSNLSGTPGLGFGPSQPNIQSMTGTSAASIPSATSMPSGGSAITGDLMDNLWGGLTSEQFTNLLNTGGRLWSIGQQSQALKGMQQALEQQQQMAEDAYNRYIAEQEKRQQLNF